MFASFRKILQFRLLFVENKLCWLIWKSQLVYKTVFFLWVVGEKKIKENIFVGPWIESPIHKKHRNPILTTNLIEAVDVTAHKKDWGGSDLNEFMEFTNFHTLKTAYGRN